jgi:transcription elongation factor Elf1
MIKNYKHAWYIKNRDRILKKHSIKIKNEQEKRKKIIHCLACGKELIVTDDIRKYCNNSECQRIANFNRGKKFRESNKDYLKEYYKEYDMVNAELRKITGRNGHLRRKYGITSKDYDRMFIEQEGKCAICGKSEKKLHVDHNHKTNKVRKLLCFHCNSGLGHFVENQEFLLRAIEYLKEYE